MRILTNVTSINAQRNLSQSNNALSQSLERLSSGRRINKAGDDAAGLAISERLTSQTRGISQAIRNAADGVSMIQTAEGALSTTQSILQRMRELAVQSANGALSDTERSAIQQEFSALNNEINRIANTTRFGAQNLLNGGLGQTFVSTGSMAASVGITQVRSQGIASGSYTITASAGTGGGIVWRLLSGSGAVLDSIQVASAAAGSFQTRQVVVGGIEITFSGEFGADASFVVSLGSGATNLVVDEAGGTTNQISLSIGNMTNGVAGLNTVNLNVSTASGADAAMTALSTALNSVSTERGRLGAIQNRLDMAITNLGVAFENLSASNSRIRDTDFAQEVANMVRSQILAQSGTAVAAQANQMPQNILSLLR